MSTSLIRKLFPFIEWRLGLAQLGLALTLTHCPLSGQAARLPFNPFVGRNLNRVLVWSCASNFIEGQTAFYFI